MQGVVACTCLCIITLCGEESFSYRNVTVNVVTELGVVGVRKEGWKSQLKCTSQKIQKPADPVRVLSSNSGTYSDHSSLSIMLLFLNKEQEQNYKR